MDIKELTDILSVQRDVYVQMLETEKGKTKIMIDGDTDALDRTITSEQSLIMKINNLESKRLNIQNKLGYGGMSLLQVISAQQENEEAGALRGLHGELTGLLADIKEVNALNMSIISTRLELIDGIMAHIGVPSGATGTYTNMKNIRDDKDMSTMVRKI